MTATIKDCPMAEPMRMVKVSEKNYDRLKKYGFAGESINTALERVLNKIEDKHQKD
jgi:hypothetical protein